MSIYQKRYVRGISYIYIFFFISSIFVYSQSDTGQIDAGQSDAGQTDAESNAVSQGNIPANTEQTGTQTDAEQSDGEQANTPVNEAELLFAPENAADDDVIGLGQTPSIGAGDVFRVFFVLIVLLGIGVGVVWFLKKFQAKDTNFNTSIIDIISSKQISQTSSIHIIKVANEYMLIGNSEQSLNLIKTYTEKEKIDEITLALSEAEAEQGGSGESQTFLKRLQKKLFVSNTLSLSKKTLAKKHTTTNIVSMILGRKEI